ncbi:MAG: OprO/OprP family phosphate-selective porin [Bacteroidales bacterium]|jgi:phosphate-selective porin|nr:OprO/OprP family phosphate-selective porin [Bacteroidales bacterium]
MRSIVIILSFLCFANIVTAQTQDSVKKDGEQSGEQIRQLDEKVKKLQKIKISGYIQGQFQWGEENASLKVGAANENPEKSFNRIGIRRGRIKFAYEGDIATGVFQLDLTEKGIGFKDVYFAVKDPWIKTFSLKAGIFDRPFGYEIGFSSSRRESPERSTLFQTLFPDERDLGLMLTIQAPKTSAWNFLKLEAGLFAGNGIKLETDNRKDFITHLSAEKKLGKVVTLSGGVSYYNGGVYQGSDNVYTMDGKSFVLDSMENKGKFAKREYFGLDARISIKSVIGTTQLRGEYIMGQQPAVAKSTKSPNASTLPTHDTYIRNFSGWYIMFVQDIWELPLSVVAKYDVYNPNRKISSNEIGLNGSSSADLAQSTLGLGLLWNATKDIRLQAYYEFNKNEKSQNVSDYEKDRKNDVFTLRLQYKF